MPSPSQAFIRAFKSIGNKGGNHVSLVTANKRYLAAKLNRPELTIKDFLCDSDNLLLTREFVSFDFQDVGKLSVAEASRAIALKWPDFLTEAGVRYRIDAYLKRNLGVSKFESLEDLYHELNNLQIFRQANPVCVDGRYFHNLAELRDSFQNELEIAERSLLARVAEVKNKQGLKNQDTLELSQSEFKSLISRYEPKMSLDDFKRRVFEYQKTFNVQLVEKISKSDARWSPQCPEDAYRNYQNNQSKFLFLCAPCCSEDGSWQPFSKSVSKFHQGCPACSDRERAQNRMLSIEEVKRRILLNPAGIEWEEEEGTYLGNSLPMTVRCQENGHEITRVAQEFFEYGSFTHCPECAPGLSGKIGETLSVAVVHYLLGCEQTIDSVRELTPEHLKSWLGRMPLRHDGFFEVRENGLKIAVEHMGSQHTDKDHPFHAFSARGADSSYFEMIRRDEWKRGACEAAKIYWVEIPELCSGCFSLVEAAEKVATILKESCGEVVTKIDGFSRRERQLSDKAFVRNLLCQGRLLSTESRLTEQLEKENSPVRVVDYDPLTRVFKLKCKNHPKAGSWDVTAINAISSSFSGKKGTRCPSCAVETRASKSRLSEKKLRQRAKKFGLKPLFEYQEYSNNEQQLFWGCRSNSKHDFYNSVGHLDRGCRHCRKEADLERRRQIYFPRLKQMVEARGDEMLSVSTDYDNQDSVLRLRCTRAGGCKKPFLMTAGKIKVGQMCSCDKHQRAASSRRARRAGKA